MTPEEAIDIISTNPVAYPDPDAQGVWDEAIRTALSALEKQVGKKPHKNYSRLHDVWCECGWYLGRYGEGKNYCKKCGQKIDWSVTG